MTENRAYRKKLLTSGKIYISGEELDIKVINLSLTGVLIKLPENNIIREAKDVFEAIKISPVIDLYLPQLKIAGEAEVVRMENHDDYILLGLEFTHINYEVDHFLYKRKAYRKSLAAPGKIKFDGEDHVFTTENVSVDGLMIRLSGIIDASPNTITTYEFKRFDLSGVIKVIWVEHEENSTLMGLEYLEMKKEIDGIPRFFS